MATLRKLPFSKLGNVYAVFWYIAIGLFVAWFAGKFVFGKGGFIHILLLCAVAVALVQWVAHYRAAQQ
jgi:hypothetical protein